jgi:hypothetical protein
MDEQGKCPVCGGSGDYPIFDQMGRERYAITCPECFGSGKDYDAESVEEEPDLPPKSTAAGIKSMDELRDWVRKQEERP